MAVAIKHKPSTVNELTEAYERGRADMKLVYDVLITKCINEMRELRDETHDPLAKGLVGAGIQAFLEMQKETRDLK